MPPANSPTNHLTASSTPVRSRSPASYLPELGELGSPVPDLASTLTIDAEDDADADNVSFLRTPISSISSARTRSRGAQNYPRNRALSTLEQSLSGELRARRNRIDHERQSLETHESRSEGMRSSHVSAGQSASAAGVRSGARPGRSPYGVQAPNQQSLYDWAPATEEGEEDELEEIMQELREQQPNIHPDILRVLGRAQLDAQNELRIQARARTSGGSNVSSSNADSSQPPQNHEPSLRSAAILQSVRRNRQLSARSRDLMQRYVMDRERAGNETEDRDRSNSSMWFRVAANANDSQRWEQNRLAWQASQRNGGETSSSTREARTGETLEALRRRYLDDPNNSPSKFESIIRVLDRVRAPHFDLDEVQKLIQKGQRPSRTSADMSALATLGCGLDPPRSSWLSAGTILTGYQQAAPMPVNSGVTVPHQTTNNQTSNRAHVNPARPSDTRTQNDSAVSAALPHSVIPDKDRWAVRVAVHAVDYENMTLQGTMEAYNVPWIPSPHRIPTIRNTSTTTNNNSTTNDTLPAPVQPSSQSNPTADTTTHPPNSHPSPPKTTFSTYLEGELLDFSTNTLRTTTHASTPADDAKYWRRLAPFSSLPDDQLAMALLNPSWLERELRNKYVLMRWKERCFVRGCLVGREPGHDVRTGNPAGLDTVQGITAAGLETIHRVSGSESFFAGSGVGGDENSGDGGTAAAEGRAGSTQAGYGLSISGFYYVSMRRSDGHVEGLYFDPASAPYQHLDLRPEGNGKLGKGAWEFA